MRIVKKYLEKMRKYLEKARKHSISEILLTALITAVITSICSFLLTRNQLSKEQEYWEKRLLKERAINILDKQISLFEEVNSMILELQILTKEIKILAAKFNINSTMLKYGDNSNSKEFDELYNKLVDYHKKLYSHSSKIQMLPLYFTNGVDSLIEPLRKTLELNYKNNFIIGEEVDLKNIQSYFDKDFETIEELENVRTNLLKAMIDDISRTNKLIFYDNNE